MTYSSHWGDNGQYLPYWRAPRFGPFYFLESDLGQLIYLTEAKKMFFRKWSINLNEAGFKNTV
jgi:hypothetical protein